MTVGSGSPVVVANLSVKVGTIMQLGPVAHTWFVQEVLGITDPDLPLTVCFYLPWSLLQWEKEDNKAW